MILFERFGYIVENIEIENASEVFRILSKDILDDSNGESELLRERRVLKQEVRHMFDSGEYQIIGIRVSGSEEYIGLFVSNERDNIPWLGYFSILKKYRKRLVTIVLAHYMINILYQTKSIQLGHFDTTGFGKHIKSLQRMLGVSVLVPNTGKRIAKIINRGR